MLFEIHYCKNVIGQQEIVPHEAISIDVGSGICKVVNTLKCESYNFLFLVVVNRRAKACLKVNSRHI